MSLIKIYSTDEPEWDLSLKKYLGESYEFHYNSAYHKLFEENGTKKAQLFVYTENGFFFLIPFVKRKIDDHYFDATSTFGYTGFKSNSSSTDFLIKANGCYIDYLKKNNVIAELIRFSLFDDSISIATKISIKLDAVKPYLVNSLNITQEEMFAIISPRIRTYIRKAEKLFGNKTHITKDPLLINNFISIYKKHMKEKGADEYYFFNDSYFSKLNDLIDQNGFLVCVIEDGVIISGLIFIYNQHYSYYHHGARNIDFNESDLANKYLFWIALNHLHSIGCRYCLLGGGVENTEEDALYRFKKKYGGAESFFHIGKRIIMADEYETKCKKWENQHPELISKYKNYLDKYMFNE